MAVAKPIELQDYLDILPSIKQAPQSSVWLSYDTEADVLYVNFKQNAQATESILTDVDVIIRYEAKDIIGFTILHASQR